MNKIKRQTKHLLSILVILLMLFGIPACSDTPADKLTDNILNENKESEDDNDEASKEDHKNQNDENNSTGEADNNTAVNDESDSVDKNTETENNTPPVEEENKLVQIPFSAEETIHKQYTDLESELKNLGFSNITFATQEMNYEDASASDGSVVLVTIDGKSDFAKDTEFTPESAVVITYCEDKRIAIPKSENECVEAQYEDIVKFFTDAGFTNVKVEEKEIEYTENVASGSIISVSVGGGSVFKAGEKFVAETPILIQYRKVLPKPTPTATPKPTATPTPKPTATSTPKPTQEIQNPSDEVGEMVWIPTRGGKKYHNKSTCSNMKDPDHVSLSRAKTLGFDACKKCYR